MKVLKYLFILLFASLGSLQAKDYSKDEIKMLITGVHTRVYSLENMLVTPYVKNATEDGVKDWRNLMGAVNAFVEKGSWLSRHKDCKEIMVVLNAASEKLILERTSSYQGAFSGSLAEADRAAGLSRLDPSRITFSKINFTDLREANNAIQAESRKVGAINDSVAKTLAGSLFLSASKREKYEVIGQLALTLQLTLEKFTRDFGKLEAASKGR
jgi:hypothetical protein